MHGAQALAESLQTTQGSRRHIAIQSADIIESGGQPHHFSQPIENDKLPVLMTRNNHVKTI
jgi:hypothetical protein